MTEEILRLAKLLGEVDARDDELLRGLCVQAEIELRGRLRDGLTQEEYGEVLPLGCAWLALADLCVRECAESSGGFTAGGLTIRPAGGAVDREKALRRRAETVMGPYLKERGFCFTGVRG